VGKHKVRCRSQEVHVGLTAGSCAPASWFGGSDWVRTGSPGSGPPPNPELDFGSGSAPVPNLGPDLGPVH